MSSYFSSSLDSTVSTAGAALHVQYALQKTHIRHMIRSQEDGNKAMKDRL